MAYATVSDVEVRYGRTLTTSESAQVGAWIDDLESEILERIPTLPDLITDGRPTEATLRRVISAAVIRKLQNPEGLRTTTVAIDDYSTTKTVDSSNSGGFLGLTDDEWSLLLPGSTGDAFTITPYGLGGRAADWYTTDGWIPA
jgi:hypothetical protein